MSFLESGQIIDDMIVDDIADQTTDTLLETLSLEIMEDSINQQINSNANQGRDFLSTIYAKFDAIKQNTDTETFRSIESVMLDWCNRMILSIVHKYNLGYDNSGEESSDCMDILESLYNFFIIDRHQNTLDFFIRYIEINKCAITETLGLAEKTGDLTTIANKKKQIPNDNIPILSNLDEVIRYVASNGAIDSEEFLGVINDGEYHTANVLSYYQNGMLYGNFYSQYIGSDFQYFANDASSELRIELRMALMN